MSNDWNYGRSGWNKRGPSDRELLANAIERSNENSFYWQRKALKARNELIEKMGCETFEGWAEDLWPGATIDDYSWKHIWNTYSHELERCERLGINKNPNDDPKHLKTHGS